MTEQTTECQHDWERMNDGPPAMTGDRHCAKIWTAFYCRRCLRTRYVHAADKYSGGLVIMHDGTAWVDTLRIEP